MPTLDALLVAAERLEAAPSAGWGASEVFQHCAQSIEYSVQGFPSSKPALFQATIGKVVKGRFLARGEMKHDLHGAIPGAPALDSGLPLPAALARLRQSIAAFRAHTGPLAPHFAYGKVTREEYESLHALHLAEHLKALGSDLR